MCSLFGIIDYQNVLSSRQKNKILSVLSRECEVRGTDATGIAFRIVFEKSPLIQEAFSQFVYCLGCGNASKANIQTTFT